VSGCIFCAIVTGDAPARLVREDERTVAFLDLNPATRGHALVVPRTHATDLLDADPTDVAALATAAQELARATVEALDADGVNVLQSSRPAAFQTVFHLHLHVIPRYVDDGLRLPWVPTPGDPSAMDETAHTLRSALA
jgi:histidine triad (HIT) family protein